MAQKIGPNGEITISQEIRDRLGVEPDWLAVPTLVDDHVEVYFVPPPHNRSLKGILAKYSTVHLAPGEEWDRGRERAWEEAVRERWGSRGETHE